MSSPEARTAFFDQAEAYTDYLCARVGTMRLLVKTEDKHVGRSLFMKQGRGEFNVLRRCVVSLRALLGEEVIVGRTFVDVGANIGTTTIPALCAHEFADAVALEPEPENFVTLRLNLVLNGLEARTRTLRVAASNTVGELDLMVNRSQGGKHWIAVDRTRLKPSRLRETPLRVPTVTLDSLVADGALDPDRVGLLWIDAQNHEGQILEGASELVRRGVPIAFEWDPKGLDRRGDRGKIQDIVAEHYTHFAGMRASAEPDQPKFQLRPAATLPEYALRFLGGRKQRFTDVLVLRLSAERAEADLSAILRRPPRAANVAAGGAHEAR